MKNRRLSDAYRYPGFTPQERVTGVFGDSKARIVRLERTGKKLSVVLAGGSAEAFTIRRPVAPATYPVVTPVFTLSSNPEGSSARRAGR